MEISETETDDRRLVNKFIRNRNERSFRSLYRRHTPTLYRLALRLAGGVEADAQDLIQDTWFRACGSLAEFSLEVESADMADRNLDQLRARAEPQEAETKRGSVH
jgi:hypothetical protein